MPDTTAGRLPFTLLDVFTRRPFAGNQLPVILDADGLSDEQMLGIAREFELSETSFVLNPKDPACDWRVRFWTPYEEVPVAGHPLVGTALLLADLDRSGRKMALETAVGPVAIEVDDDETAWIGQPRAEFGPIHTDRAALAAALTLEPDELRSDLHAQVVSCGHEFLLVPVTSLAAMRRVRGDRAVWKDAFAGFPDFAFCFSEEVEGVGMAAHCRLLAPYDIASGEDAASGSAAAPLAAYLWQNLRGRPAGGHQFTFEQGIEMGRPSELDVRLADGGRTLSVGGHASVVATGEIRVPSYTA
jgi:trans-2,3-dihydro-3-hydroxyanthranilate isomerase